jgi:hypothetical protein
MELWKPDFSEDGLEYFELYEGQVSNSSIILKRGVPSLLRQYYSHGVQKRLMQKDSLAVQDLPINKTQVN